MSVYIWNFFKKVKKYVLVFQKHLGRGCFSPFNNYNFYALVFLRRGDFKIRLIYFSYIVGLASSRNFLFSMGMYMYS